MANVKDNPVSLRNWTRVQRISPYKREQLVCLRAGSSYAFQERMVNIDNVFCSEHGAASTL
jgi:hypothetical protein